MFLDAIKVFGSVNYGKLFHELLKRDLPSIYVTLLVNLYTNTYARISWNGVHSKNI